MLQPTSMRIDNRYHFILGNDLSVCREWEREKVLEDEADGVCVKNLQKIWVTSMSVTVNLDSRSKLLLS